MCLCSSSVHCSALFVNAITKYITTVSVITPNSNQVIVVYKGELVFSIFALLGNERIPIAQKFVLGRLGCISAVAKRLVEACVLLRLDKLRRRH